MTFAKRLPTVSLRRTSGVSRAWWFAQWLLVLLLAFDHVSAPFHRHHHDRVEGQMELVAAHESLDHGDVHVDADEHPQLSHSAMALRIEPSQLGQLPAVDRDHVAVTIPSVVRLLIAFDEPTTTHWRPDRSRPDFHSHRSLPPAGRAPLLHA